VLVTTFSKRLALALEIKLKRLLDQDPAALARVTVAHVDGIGYRLHELFFRAKPNVASAAQVESALTAAAKELGEERFSRRFLLAEWQTVVDAWQLKSWEDADRGEAARGAMGGVRAGARRSARAPRHDVGRDRRSRERPRCGPER
jgi:hypothetical protein